MKNAKITVVVKYMLRKVELETLATVSTEELTKLICKLLGENEEIPLILLSHGKAIDDQTSLLDVIKGLESKEPVKSIVVHCSTQQLGG